MTVQTNVSPLVSSPDLPRVNLLPGEIEERRRFRQIQAGMGGAVVAAAVIVGALYVAAHHGVQSAQKNLDAANTEHAQLRAQAASLQHVSDVYDQVSQRQAMLTTARAGEVHWSRYLNDLSIKIPDNVWLTNLTITEGTSSTPSASTPTTGNSIGSITFSGVAFSHNDVANWLDSLAKEHGYSDVYFSNSTESTIGTRPVVNFTSAATPTTDALWKSAGS